MRLVSVIIPTYNSSCFIERTLKSIIEQTYTNIEMIIVDNNSNDDTVKVVSNIMCSNNKKYILLDEKSQGVSYARNKGIKYANGEYVMFLDSDDYIVNNCIEELVGCCEINSVDMACCKYNYVDDNDKIITKFEDDYLKCEGKFKKNRLIKKMFLDEFWVCTSSFIIKKKCIDENALKYNTVNSYGEDTEFIVSLMNKCSDIMVLDKTLSIYVYRETSATNKVNSKIFQALDSYQNLELLFKDNHEINYLIKTIFIPRKCVGIFFGVAKSKISIGEIMDNYNKYNVQNYLKYCNVDDVFVWKIKKSILYKIPRITIILTRIKHIIKKVVKRKLILAK